MTEANPSPGPVIRALGPSDFDEFRTLRGAGLATDPAAFTTGETEWQEASEQTVRQLLARSGTADWVIFGAFEAGLGGLVGVGRETKANARHKAAIWGLYVPPDRRRSGIGGALVRAAVAHARTLPDLRMLRISVASRSEIALRLFTSAGFRTYGVEPGGRWTPDGYCDVVYLYLPLVPD
jgi:RimJ/RimL family protein N-acetyltransferase